MSVELGVKPGAGGGAHAVLRVTLPPSSDLSIESARGSTKVSCLQIQLPIVWRKNKKAQIFSLAFYTFPA